MGLYSDYTKDWQTDVRAFHYKMGLYVGKKPEWPSEDEIALAKKLIIEEAIEVVEAIDERDLVHTAQELADLIYVVCGAANRLGIDLGPVFDEVQRANMNKEGGAMRADGKLLKPEGWQPPDIKGALRLQGWEDESSEK